jgi:DNA topoisomerase IA
MTAPRQSAHPILEPLEHALTPERAALILAGDNLTVYSLLWKAAIATAMDGPALRAERLTLDVNSDAFPGNVRLQAAQVVSEESGWGELLPSELHAAEYRIDEFAAPFPSLQPETPGSMQADTAAATQISALPPQHSLAIRAAGRSALFYCRTRR